MMGANTVSSREEEGCVRYDFMRDSEDPSTFYTFEIFASPAAHAVHMKTPTMKAWGAFQYGDRKPIVKKRVTKLVNVDVGEKTTAPPASSIAAVGMIEVSVDAAQRCEKLLLATAAKSREEPGCLCYDIFRSLENPNAFYTYELFSSPTSRTEHDMATYARDWVEGVGESKLVYIATALTLSVTLGEAVTS